MLKLSLGLLVIGLSVIGHGACGRDSATAGDASVAIDGRITVDSPPALDAAHPGDFITGDVDGTTVRVEADTMSGTAGLAAGRIWVNAGKSAPAWNIYIPNSVGTSTCPPDWVALFEVGGAVARSDNPGSSCSVTVTAAAPALGDVIDGTFTATLTTTATSSSPVRTAVVTNGAFHVTRTFQ
jgi:hypothetical protein